MELMARLRLFCLAVLLLALLSPIVSPAIAQEATGIDFGAPQPVIDLGPSLIPERIRESNDINGSWFTISVQNRQPNSIARVLTAFGSPGAALSFDPVPARPTIAQVVPSDPLIVVEWAPALGANAFRVLLPPGRTIVLTLHLENATDRHPLLAWSEAALIANNRQTAILDGLIVGLLTAAALLSAAAALLSSRVFAGWAALFLFAILMADLTSAGFLDFTPLAALTGPYALFALWTALAMAAAIRVVDYVAPFEAFWRKAAKWRDRVALAVIGLGMVAYAGAPLAGVLVRVFALFGAAAAAGYLAHCGRIGVAAARRLAPAATVFALVTAAAGLNALGAFGVNLAASSALSGFSAAGALLLALASTIPAEHSVERLRRLRRAHRDDDLQAITTDEVIGREWETAAMAASQQGVFDLNLVTGTLSLSHQAAAIFGLQPAPAELKIKAWSQRIVPEDWDFLRQTLDGYRERPEVPFRVEFRTQTNHGPRWCELRATVTARTEMPERCFGLIADITARKSSERQSRPHAGAISA